MSILFPFRSSRGKEGLNCEGDSKKDDCQTKRRQELRIFEREKRKRDKRDSNRGMKNKKAGVNKMRKPAARACVRMHFFFKRRKTVLVRRGE